MTARATSLCSLFVIIAIMFVAAQSRQISPQAVLQMQEDHIDSVDKISQENKRVTELLAARLAQVENDNAMQRGAVLGFGGLLSVLQIVGLIKKRRDDY